MTKKTKEPWVKIIGQAHEKDAAQPVDWHQASAQAISSLSAITASSTATGLEDLARESTRTTTLIVNHFHFATSPEEVPDEKYLELKARAVALAAELKEELKKGPDKSHAQKCLDELESNLQRAATKSQIYLYYTNYFMCQGHGFLSIKSIIGKLF